MPYVFVIVVFQVLLRAFIFAGTQNEEASIQTVDAHNGSRIASYGRFFNKLCTRSMFEPMAVCDYPYPDGPGIFPKQCCYQPTTFTEGENYFITFLRNIEHYV